MALIGELLLVRHGEAHCNVAGLVGGERTCTGLTPYGREQVDRLAIRLRALHQAGSPIDVLYASPRRRVRETGELLADTLGLPLHVELGLEGPRHGTADGQPWSAVKDAFGGPPAARPDRPYATGAEAWNAYLDRAIGFIRTLLDRHPEQRVLIAAHGETIQAAHLLLLGLPSPARTHVDFATRHAGLTRWQLHRNRYGRTVWTLVAHNDTAHLADLQR
ncbi:MAG TPA: histidine phosphatase family protein [Actinomycetes bacterium]|jgi:probable phosphoglycerate mutase|nr:histidine phosphatase family protein [Actinomycetes bacterium]